MEESPTPWLIAETIESSGMAALWVWVSMLIGVAVVLLGAAVFCA
jgi:hypothetical protein